MFRKAVTAGVAPPKDRESLGQRLWRWTDGLLDAAVLQAHALAVRLDRVPPEFGDGDPVDETDPQALAREWRRQYRIWADSSPEQLFAIKVGAVLLGGALIVLLIFIAAL